MKPTIRRTLAHRFEVGFNVIDGGRRRRGAGTAVLLLSLSLSACGRGGDGATEATVKVQSAVVTGTAPVLATSSGTTSFIAQGGAVVVDPTLSLTISDGSDLDGMRAAITTGFVSGQDTLSVTTQTGVTSAYNSTTGILTLTGTVPVTTYQAILRTVTYNNSAGASPNTQTRTVTFSVGATSLTFGGHYYEFVNTGNLTWANARTAAAARRFYGLQGYLATVTSTAENSFINAKLTATGWIGASDQTTEGVWRWVTGPEGVENGGLGRQFWMGAANGATVNGQFSSWNGGEPNNSGGAENWAQFFVGGLWNDLPATSALAYMVEYGGTAGDPTPQVSATKDVSVTILPSFAITASAGANGTVSPAGTTSVLQGQSAAYTITPNANFSVNSVLVDGVSVGAVTTFTFNNVTATHTISATFSPPSISVTAGSNQTALTGAAFGTGLSALVTDSGGTPLSGRTVVFTAPGAGASATLTGTGVTNASGIATVTATANGTAGTYSVTATVSGTTAATTFALRNLGAPSTITIVGGTSQSAAIQTAFGTALLVIVRDSTAFALPNITVTFAAPSTGASATLSGTAVTTNSTGQASVTATAGTVAGNYAVSAAATGIATPVNFALTNVAGPAAQITITSGATQSVAVGTAFAPIVARVTDSVGNSVSGATVTFAAPTSGASGTLSATTATTNATGQGQTAVTANTIAGGYTVSATTTVTGGGTVSANATLTNTPGAGALLAVTSGNGQIALTGAAFASPLAVRVTDASGNTVPGTTITFTAVPSSTGASATLSSATAVTNSSGLASVTATANNSVGSYSVVASHSTAPSASISLTNQFLLGLSPSTASVATRASATFAATGGTGTGYLFSIQSGPSGGTINATTGAYTAGATPSVTDVIRVVDSGNHTATANVTVGAALALSSSLSQVPPRGPATFTTTGGTGAGLTFTISTNRSHGTIDATGHYVAGPTASVTDILTVTDSVGNSATSSIDVGADITLTGSAAHTPPRGSLTFTSTGGAGTFTYALQANPSGGTIDATTGAYSAGSAPDVTDVVTATDALGNVAAANVAVGDGVTVNPPAPAVPPLGTITLAATGGSGTGYTYALGSGASGTIGSATGVYIAGAVPNVSVLVTVTDSLGNLGTTSVSVGGGLQVTPSSLTLAPRGSRAFTVTGGSGTGYAFTLPTHTSGGTVDGTTGGYIAGATGSTTDVLRVVDSLGNQGTVTITVGPTVAVSPTTATLAPLGQQTISISGGSGVGYAFALSASPSGGHVDGQTGDYVAGAVGGVTDVITASDSLGNTATASITVTTGLVAGTGTLSASPRAAAQVSVTGGAPAYIFSISSNGSGGTIDPVTGAYLAGGNPDSTDVITITDQNGAVINIVVTIGPGVAIVPNHPSTSPRGTVAFGATGGSGSGYRYSISNNQSGASIDATTGAYAAGATGSVADTITATDSLGNTAVVSVAVGGRLVLSPISANVAPRESVALSAFGGSGTGFTYAFSTNASAGSLDMATGAYVAGTTPNVADVVQVTDSLGNQATNTISVGPALTVAPAVATTPPRGTLTLNSAGGSGTGYLFTVSTNGSGGTVSASGVYTAGAVGDTSDVVTVTDSFGNTSTVTVTVDHAVTLTAAAATVAPRGTTTFTAAGGVGDGFQYTLQTNGSGGDIVRSTGVYTAGSHGGATDVIEATDPFGNTATRSITVGPGVGISPSAPAVSPRGEVTLVATGGSGSGYVFTFTQNASGGTIGASTGLYTAGSTSDAHDTVQVVDSLGNSASVSISVGGALTVATTIPTVAPRDSVTIMITGGSGTGYMFALTTNGSGGTIDPATGKYTAGSTGNTQDVIAVTDSVGNTAHVTITLGDGLHITPATSNAAPRAQIAFAVTGGSGQGYAYAVSTNNSNGTIDAVAGAYRAGTTGGVTDTVTVTDSLGNTASATVTLSAALTSSVPTIMVAPHGTATVAVTGGAAPLMYTLSTNGSGGSINPTTGVYTAGPKGGTTDIITVSDANGATITLTVQIGAGISVAPISGAVVTGQIVPLTSAGGSASGLQWTVVTSGSGGTIDHTTGVYTAGLHAGTDVVRVTDSLGNTSQVTITVTDSKSAHQVNPSGGGCNCSTGVPPGAGGGDVGARSAAALGLMAFGLALASRRRRRRDPSAPRAG